MTRRARLWIIAVQCGAITSAQTGCGLTIEEDFTGPTEYARVEADGRSDNHSGISDGREETGSTAVSRGDARDAGGAGAGRVEGESGAKLESNQSEQYWDADYRVWRLGAMWWDPVAQEWRTEHAYFDGEAGVWVTGAPPNASELKLIDVGPWWDEEYGIWRDGNQWYDKSAATWRTDSHWYDQSRGVWVRGVPVNGSPLPRKKALNTGGKGGLFESNPEIDWTSAESWDWVEEETWTELGLDGVSVEVLKEEDISPLIFFYAGLYRDALRNIGKGGSLFSAGSATEREYIPTISSLVPQTAHWLGEDPNFSRFGSITFTDVSTYLSAPSGRGIEWNRPGLGEFLFGPRYVSQFGDLTSLQTDLPYAGF